MNLILIHPEELTADKRVVLHGQRAKHIRTVLRATPGKTLKIGLLNGPFGRATVEEISGHTVTLHCEFEDTAPPRPRIDLLLALPRPKVLKRLWAQLAALGVGRIILTNAEKVERCYFDSHVIRPDFFNKLLIEGLQQARDTRLPEVLIRKRLKPFLEDELDTLCPETLRLTADPSATARISETVTPDETRRVLLAVGPEGGWTPYELDLLNAHGFSGAGMGDRILRSDTACIALLSILAESLRI